MKKLIVFPLTLALMLSPAMAFAKGIPTDGKSYAQIADSLGNLAYNKTVVVSNVSKVVPRNNLALHKPVVASNIQSDKYSGEMVVDGDPDTRWATTDADMTHTLDIDLGSETTFDRVELMQFHDRVESYKIQYWTDSAWHDAYSGGKVKAGYTNVTERNHFQPEIAEFSPVTGSKMRLIIKAYKVEPSFWDIGLYNTADIPAEPVTDPLYDGPKAVDADPGSYWKTEDSIKSATLDLDFGNSIPLNRVDFSQPNEKIGKYIIQYWDGSKWKAAFQGTSSSTKESVEFKTVTSSKLRLQFNVRSGVSGIGLSELEVYNTNADPGLSRGQRVLIDKGLQQQAWISTDQTGRYFPTAEEWRNIHFTAPTYYEAPMYNQAFHDALPASQWSLAKAPFAEHLVAGPTSQEHFLNEQQRANLTNLVSMQFGDEEDFSASVVKSFKGWFDLSRTLYPDVIVHSNQYADQWNTEQLRAYTRAAKPDLLTYDWYYFDRNDQHPGGSVKKLYDDINMFRTIALEGYDGTERSPIAFGQYTQGFKSGEDYVPSESELNIVSFATWTMGGKWLNLFRWEKDDGKDDINPYIFHNNNGNLTPSYDHYAEMVKQGNTLGDYLVRLNSSDVRIIPGEHMSNGNVVANSKPNSIPLWDPSADARIRSIAVQNIGNANHGLKGDVLIGYFEPLNGLTKEDEKFLPAPHSKYFMIMNGLTASGDAGSSEITSQKITFELDVKGEGPNSLYRVNKETGETERVQLTHVKGNQYRLDIMLGGGKADLFFWK
ncbi:discoidin domain-containing protein [Paenibacillus sp. LHD-38]|uniref:discoidin domain-containing protein n=1 Tax=Paenibacillus sp. LHD-38 TaxID=3072143 RepID=UPI00280DE895|nr:discoidin domain-containing protein [Paenibacillus sp. LHD-38]MDQ8738009.1 discoidin domain-containing protein [Paenibacillus sp. LHD-38]